MGSSRYTGVSGGSLAGEGPVGVGIQHGERFDFVSEEFAAIGGRKRRSLVGAEWRTLFEPREADRLASEGLETARSEGRWRGATELATGDGTRPVDLEVAAVAGGQLLWVISPKQTAVDPDVAASQGRHTELYNRPLFVRSLLDAIDDVLYVIDETGESFFWNEELLDTTGHSHAEIDAIHPMDLVPEDHHKYVPGLLEAIDAIEDRRMEIDIVTADGDRVAHEFRGTSFEDPETGESFRCGVARDVSERNARQRELERQRDELGTLARINDLVLETVTDLLQLSTRESVERRVCDRLAESAFYQFAWIGEPELGGDRIRPRTVAGEDEGYLEEVTITTDESEHGRGPAGRAIRTGEVQIMDVEDPAFSPWRAAASDRGFEAVIAVPLQHNGTIYGVLVVYATRERAFTEREQAGFEAIGRAVGAVINATRSHDLLFAENVVEIDLDITDIDSVFVRSAAMVDCELSLDGHVASGEQWILYCSVDGAPAGRVAEAAATDPAVESTRVIGEGTTTPRIELVHSAPSVFHTITTAGASLRSGTVTPEQASLTIEAPAVGEVREIVHDIRREYPNTRLLAQREREREATAAGRPDGLLAELTDRQREAIETAYRAGYFAWPRESTAEEIAASLDLAPATVHGHLRKAEQRILAAILGE